MSDYPDGKTHTELVFETMQDKTELSSSHVFALAILAGVYIALGGMFCAMVLSYVENGFSAIEQLLAGAVFTVGLWGDLWCADGNEGALASIHCQKSAFVTG